MRRDCTYSIQYTDKSHYSTVNKGNACTSVEHSLWTFPLPDIPFNPNHKPNPNFNPNPTNPNLTGPTLTLTLLNPS